MTPDPSGVADLLALLRGAGLAVGVDDAARVATVFRFAAGWPYATRLQALQAILARGPEERETLVRLGPLLFPDVAPADASGRGGRADTAPPREPPPPPRWPWVVAGAAVLAALAIIYVAWPSSGQGPVFDAGIAPTADAGTPNVAVDEPRWVQAPAPADRTGTILIVGIVATLAGGFAALGRHLVRARRHRRGRARVARLGAAPGRRVLTLRPPAGRDLEPIQPAALVHSAAFRLSGPTALVNSPVLDARLTVESTARAAGRIVLRVQRWREHRLTLFLEDTSASMARWPAHAGQVARALELQGQGLLHRFVAGDPRRVFASRHAARWRPLEHVLVQSGAGTVVVVSDLAWLDDPARREDRGLLAELARAIWIHPRPADLWGSGARWLAERACVVPAGSEPELRHLGTGLEVRTRLPGRWHPPTVWRGDADEIARVWRIALGDEAWDALAAAAILDVAGALDAAHLWALVSDEIVSAPWERLDRVWDLPGVTVAPGGRLSLPDGVAERMTAELRGRRPELARAAGRWISTRVQASIDAAGADSLAATAGEIQLDRIARAAGLEDPPGGRVARLVSDGLGALAVNRASAEDLAAWKIDPRRIGPPGRALLIAGAACLVASATLAVVLAGGWFGPTSPRAFGFAAPPHPTYGPADWTMRIAPRPASDRPLAVHIENDRGQKRRVIARRIDADTLAVDTRSWPAGEYTIQLAYTGEDLTPPEPITVDAEKGQQTGKGTVIDAGPTEPGQCDVEIAGQRAYTRDTVIAGTIICLRTGARLRVRNGSRLELRAEVIRMEADVDIDGSGERGVRGAAGAAPEPPLRFRGQREFQRRNRECGKTLDDPDRGKPGGRGGDGGPGATIVFAGRVEGEPRGLKLMATLVARGAVDGGASGQGGPGGRGRVHALVTAGATQPPSPGDEDGYGPAQPDVDQSKPARPETTRFRCPDGRKGDPGRPGPNGTVEGLDRDEPAAAAE